MSEQALSLPSTIKTCLPNPLKKKRNLPGTPDPDAQVIALSPKSLMATKRFVCEICKKDFQRDQNLQLHRRGHNLPWKLQQRSEKEVMAAKKVYVCPEKTCVHHHPSRALGDLTGIKKHFSRKHGEKKWNCHKCFKKYAVHSDWKAHLKICGTREYKCHCGTLFSRKDIFVTHRAFCDVLAEESARRSISLVPEEASKIPHIFNGYHGGPDMMMQTMNMIASSSSWLKPYPEAATLECFANLAIPWIPSLMKEEEEEEEKKGGLSYSAGSLYCSNHENQLQVGLSQPHDHMSSPSTSLLEKVKQIGSTGISNHIDIFGLMAGSSLPLISNTTTTPFRDGLYFNNTENPTDQTLNDFVTSSQGLVLNDSSTRHFVRSCENLDQMELGGLTSTRDFLGVGEKELAKFNAADQPWSSISL